MLIKFDYKLNTITNILLLAMCLIFVVITLDILIFDADITMTQIFSISYVFSIFLILFVLLNRKTSPISPIMFIVYYTFIQGLGIPLGYVLDFNTANKFLMRNKLFYGIYLGKYIAISILAIVSILVAIILFGKYIHNNDKCQTNYIIKNSKNLYYEIGIVLLSCFAIFMLINLLIGNISLIDHDQYSEWALESRARNYLQFGYWFGTLFVISSFTAKKQLILPIITFFISSIILIASGNRNDFLYPLLIGIAIYCYRGFKIPNLVIAIVSLFILFVSPIISSTRMSGINIINNNRSLTELASSSLCEFGSQLTPVSSMFIWLDSGENLAYGGTYIFSSIVEIVGMVFNEVRFDFELSRFNISSRLPDLGFSMPAEVMFNFGVIGIIIVYFLIGKFMIRKESSIMNPNNLVKYAFFSFSLLHLVRNSFSAYISIVLIFYFTYSIEKILRNYSMLFKSNKPKPLNVKEN